jgi:hypothetical protein
MPKRSVFTRLNSTDLFSGAVAVAVFGLLRLKGML